MGFWSENEGVAVMRCNLVRFEGVHGIAGHDVKGCIRLRVMVIEEHDISPLDCCFVGLVDKGGIIPN